MNILQRKVSISTSIYTVILYLYSYFSSQKQEFNSLLHSSCFRAAPRHAPSLGDGCCARPAAGLAGWRTQRSSHLPPPCLAALLLLFFALTAGGSCRELWTWPGKSWASGAGLCAGAPRSTRWQRRVFPAGLGLVSDVSSFMRMSYTRGALPFGNTKSGFLKLNLSQLRWNQWEIQMHSISENTTLRAFSKKSKWEVIKIPLWNFTRSDVSISPHTKIWSNLSLPQIWAIYS